MPKSIKPFLIGAIALSVGASATVTAFAAPKPDAPDIPATAKPVKVYIKPHKKRTVVNIKAQKSAKPKVVAATGLRGVVIDEPSTEDGTITVVTATNEFATIAVGAGTKISRGAILADLSNVHTGYVIRCQGAWDQDGFRYQANHVFLGGVVRDTDVVGRVNAACENIAHARKGGGFGKSLVAMVPLSSMPRAVAIGEKAQPARTRPDAPTTPTQGTSAQPGTTQPAVPGQGTPATGTSAPVQGAHVGSPVPQAPIK